MFGKSGTGKTFSALLLARGIAGPNGKVGLIDTETGRGSLYADLIPGGYEVLDLFPPFSPEAYGKALEAAEAAGIDCVVIDSMSHEWNGQGGYLDMKEEAIQKMTGGDWSKRDRCAMAAAAKCKPMHNRLIEKMLRSPMSMILCFRAKERVRMEKESGANGRGGRTKIETDEHSSPIQDSDLIFEMLISAETVRVDGKPGCMRLDASDPQTKWSHPDVLALLPADGEQIGIKHGEAIARWANNPGGSPVQKPVDPTAKLKLELWNETKADHGGNKEAFEALLRGNKLIDPDEQVSELSAERINKILSQVRDMKAAQE